MSDWNAIRKIAQARHDEIRRACASDSDTSPLLSADQILKAAESLTDLDCVPVKQNDSLLSGAFALLDRANQSIVFAAEGLSPERIRFIKAHEFAHFWLHPDTTSDSEIGDDLPETYLGESPDPFSKQVESDYSPAERREKEANVFASELLLPLAPLRNAYLKFGWNASKIAHHTGLSETFALTQLQSALLLPEETAENPNDAPRDSLEQVSPPGSSLLNLDPSQLEAATIEMGPVLIDAGPGTGKTKTLISRILHLLQDRKIVPEQILALTFSNKAANEMQHRLFEAAGEIANRVWIGTFHAFGLEVLRKEGTRIGLSRRPRLIDTADAIALLLQHYDSLNLSQYEYLSQPTLPFGEFLACISRAKDELRTPEDYLNVANEMKLNAETDEQKIEADKALEVARIYEIYERLLLENGLLDFGDLLFRTVRLFESFPDVRREWQAKYPHILADEYQDINRASARVLQCIAGEGRGFWAVGDLRQAIYRFRGASPANIRQFETDFPGGVRLQLKRNYRSLPRLVSLFSGVASKLDDKTTLWEAHRLSDDPAIPNIPGRNGTENLESTPPLQFVSVENPSEQSDWLASQILQNQGSGIALSSQAILVPTNRHASELAEALLERGIPAQHLGNLFERPEIKDLLALLSCVIDPEGVGLWRVANFREFAISREDISCILRAAKTSGEAFPYFLSTAANLPELSESGRTGVAKLWQSLKPIVYLDDPWQILTRFLFETSDYMLPLLKKKASEKRAESLHRSQSSLAIFQFLVFVQEVSNSAKSGSPTKSYVSHKAAFMTRLRFLFHCKQAKSPRLPEEANRLDAIRIMTIHQSKGLEFPVVFLPNLIKGQFPTRNMGKMAKFPAGLLNSNSGIDSRGKGAEGRDESDTDEDADNSRRLFFVALSRARDSLTLIRPRKWKTKDEPASPRLIEIEELIAELATEEKFTSAVGELGTGSSEGTETVISPEPPVIPKTRPAVSHSAIKLYMNCPRRYYYRYVEHLPEVGENSDYLDFHTILTETLSRIQEGKSTGNRPDFEEAKSFFEERWKQPEGENSGHRESLRRRAMVLIEHALADDEIDSGATVSNQFRAEFPAGSIDVRSNRAELQADGALLLTRVKWRGRKKDDHTAPELSLLRRAAQQREPGKKINVSLQYLLLGETVESPEKPKLEANRVAKYEIALENLAAGDFSPSPSDACPACPYYAICDSHASGNGEPTE